MYIVNPLREWGGWANSLFNTHPPADERIRRLREMSGQPGFAGKESTADARRE
jgi:Zn-dependent protease with chaperone function